jgi:autotransporter-associated beta strand protein
VSVNSDVVVTTLSGGDLTLGAGNTLTVSEGSSAGTIAGSGTLAKTGTGTLELSGDNSDFSGAINATAGTVKVTDVAALGNTSGVTLGTAAGASDAKLQIATTSATEVTANISATNTTSANIVENSGTGALTLSGSLTKNGTVLTLAGGSNGINITGNIIGNSAGSDLVVDTGTVKISSSNSYNGPTFIESPATLIADNASATGAGVVNVANGATLQVGTASNVLTLTTGGFAFTDGAIIRVYISSLSTANISARIDPTGATVYDQSSFAGTNYSSLATSGLLDISALTTAGAGVTIELYSTAGNNAAVTGLDKTALYDLKFLSFGSISSTANISSLFTIDYSHIRDASGNALFADSRIQVYLSQNVDGSGSLMMTIPEPSTYGLGLGALALAAVAIRRRKQKKVTV